MRPFSPLSDAFTVAKIRKAGALILGKTNLSEFARGGMSLSSLGGQTKHPYDRTRTRPAVPRWYRRGPRRELRRVSWDRQDTGLSIRSPASANSLVVYVRRAAWSAGGVIPNSETQTSWPHSPTVTDAALLLDGWRLRPRGSDHGIRQRRIPKSYTHLFRPGCPGGRTNRVMTNLV